MVKYFPHKNEALEKKTIDTTEVWAIVGLPKHRPSLAGMQQLQAIPKSHCSNHMTVSWVCGCYGGQGSAWGVIPQAQPPYFCKDLVGLESTPWLGQARQPYLDNERGRAGWSFSSRGRRKHRPGRWDIILIPKHFFFSLVLEMKPRALISKMEHNFNPST